jgi:hypothetical protein
MKCWIIKNTKCTNCNFCTDSIKEGGLGLTKQERLKNKKKGVKK